MGANSITNDKCEINKLLRGVENNVSGNYDIVLKFGVSLLSYSIQ